MHWTRDKVSLHEAAASYRDIISPLGSLVHFRLDKGSRQVQDNKKMGLICRSPFADTICPMIQLVLLLLRRVDEKRKTPFRVYLILIVFAHRLLSELGKLVSTGLTPGRIHNVLFDIN